MPKGQYSRVEKDRRGITKRIHDPVREQDERTMTDQSPNTARRYKIREEQAAFERGIPNGSYQKALKKKVAKDIDFFKHTIKDN